MKLREFLRLCLAGLGLSGLPKLEAVPVECVEDCLTETEEVRYHAMVYAVGLEYRGKLGHWWTGAEAIHLQASERTAFRSRMRPFLRREMNKAIALRIHSGIWPESINVELAS